MNANPDFASRRANGLPGAPAVSGGAVVSYERQVVGAWALKLVGQVTYVGPSRVTFDPTLPTTGGFIRSKLSAEISGKDFSAQVFVSNPLDAYNDTFAFGNPFNATQQRQVTPQRPLTVGVTLAAGI